MKVRRLNSHHDWTFGNGRSDYATKSEAIAQCVLTRLLSLRNDWFLNPESGINWRSHLVKNANLRNMEIELKSAILKTDGVADIINFDIALNVDSRKCTVSVTYRDIYNNQNEVIAHAPDNS